MVAPTRLVTPPPPQANADALRNELNTNTPANAIPYFWFIEYLPRKKAE